MKKALVVGASGGIGAALMKELETRGFTVTGVSRLKNDLDVTDPVSVDRVFNELSGPFDAVFVTTGILAGTGGKPEKTLSALDPSKMLEIYAVNAVGPALILAKVERLLGRDTSSFVAVLTARVGSIGDNRMGGWYSYRASKAAANQIVRSAALELSRKRKQSIVVALHPGTVETSFTKDYKAHHKVSASMAAKNLCDVVLELSPDQSGQFFDYNGDIVPW